MLKHDNLQDVDASHEGRCPPLTFSKRDGLLYMHNGDEWDSTFGCMVLDHPTFLWMEYAQKMMSWMLFAERFMKSRTSSCNWELGAGALTRFCHARFPLARVEVVDINPAVIDACREMFCMPPEGERLAPSKRTRWTMSARKSTGHRSTSCRWTLSKRTRWAGGARQ